MSRAADRSGARTRLATRTARPPLAGERRVTVVVPAYRDPDGIGTTVQRLHDELSGLLGEMPEVIVVDDGSADGTAEAARAAGADLVLVQPRNHGKGAAVRRGALSASGRTVAFTDADLSYAPDQVVRLVEGIEAGWDVVVGNRYHEDTEQLVEAPLLRQLGGRVINAATRVVVRGGYLDTQCGLKAFRSDVARIVFSHARVDGFAFDIELFWMAEHGGLSVLEVPVEVVNSDRSTVRVTRDAARLLLDLGHIRWDAARGRYGTAPTELLALVPQPGA